MKAILVVDKPESCTSCLLGICHKRWFCLKTLKDIEITDRYHIPKWCPLKPMPLKRKTEVVWHDDNGRELITHEYTEKDKVWNEIVDYLEGDGQNE